MRDKLIYMQLAVIWCGLGVAELRTGSISGLVLCLIPAVGNMLTFLIDEPREPR